jgi:lipopolysaccharide export system protein LptA
MRTSEAARYARWSAMAAAAITAVTLTVYAHRAWVAREERKKAPPPAPPSVERQSSELTFSKVEKDRTIFTVRASKSTELKGNSENILEDVLITIFGKEGSRHDTIHTRSCEYRKDSGRIECAGEVEIRLASAQDAALPDADARAVRIETRAVAFDRETGVAQTKERVNFAFPDGSGEATGVDYRTETGVLRMERDVEMRLRLRPAEYPQPGASDEVQLTGARLEFRRDARALRLDGPVRAVSGPSELTAGEVSLELDAKYRAQKLFARSGPGRAPRPEVRSKQPHGNALVSADEVAAAFHPQGWIESVKATGRVEGDLRGAKETERFRAEQAELSFLGRGDAMEALQATGNVALDAKLSGGVARSLKTNALKLTFSRDRTRRANRVETAETLEPGILEWTGSGMRGGKGSTRLSADRLITRFGAQGRAEELDALGNVHLDRALEGKPAQTATAQSGIARFAPDGSWTRVDLKGNVQLREAERRGQADSALFMRAVQTALLAGNAVVSDATTRTTAKTITFLQATGEIRAEGDVRTTDLQAGLGGTSLAPQPANLSSERLAANARTGRAIYSGHARLWQGDAVIAADRIELARDSRQLSATGNVQAAFPQEAKKSAGVAASAKLPALVLWRVQAGVLTYWDKEGRAHLEKNVRAVSAEQEMQAAALDVYFTTNAGSERKLVRALGTGGVTVRQGDRRGTAERGEYTASEGKFVLSGGKPTLFDASRGTTTGLQLTFYSADDTIIVDSGQGSRTLTKHRVEK